MSPSLGTKTTLLLVASLTVMAGATIAASLPDIARHFEGIKGIELYARLILTLPALFIAFGSPLAGIIVDRYGRVTPLLVALFGYAIFGSSGYYADNIFLILVGRALLGLSVAFAMTAGITLVGDLFGEKERQHFLGLQSAFVSLGGFFFITGGGYLADLDWRYPFLIYLVSLAYVPLVLMHLKEPPKPSHHDDLIDQDHRVFQPALVRLYLLAALSMVIFYLIPVQLPFYLTDHYHSNGSMVGFAIGSMTIASAAAAFSYKFLLRRFTPRTLFVTAIALAATGYLGIAAAPSVPWMMGALVLSGFGLGLSLPYIQTLMLTTASAKIRGRATGLLTASFFMGQFVSPVLAQPLIPLMGLDGLFGVTGALLGIIFLGLLRTRSVS